MKKLILTILLASTICSPAWAGNMQVFHGGRPDVQPSTTAAQVSHPWGRDAWTTPGSGTRRLLYPAASGTIREYCVQLTAQPGTGKSRTFTINHSAGSSVGTSTGIAVTLSDAETYKCSTNTYAFGAGAMLTIYSQPSDTPDAAGYTDWTRVEWDANNVSALQGATNAGGDWSNQYVGPSGHGEPSTFINRREFIFTKSATIEEFWFMSSGNHSGDRAYTADIFKNGVITDMTCTVNNAVGRECQDTVNSFSVVAGDRIALRINATSSPVGQDLMWGLKLTNDPGYFFFGVTTHVSGSISTSTTTYTNLAGAYNTTFDTEANRRQVSDDITITDGRFRLSAEPGVGKSYAMTVRNAGADTAMGCTISGNSDTTCTMTGTPLSIADGFVSVKSVPTDDPSAAVVGLFFAGYHTLPASEEANSNFLMVF